MSSSHTVALAVLLAFSAVPASGGAQPTQAVAQEVAEEEAPEGPQTKWTDGPATVDVADDVAQLQLEEAYSFAGAEDTKRMLREMGSRPSGTEAGLIVPKDQSSQSWLVVLRWLPVGYVKDDDKDDIDADGLLESIRQGTEEANVDRKARGIPALHVTRWHTPPYYDEKTHNFVWALLAKSDDGSEVINYNVRVLGREGYMSITLADDPQNLEASKPHVEKLLSGLTYKPGKTYAEWKPGDKVAEYGLVGLVAAGAGVAAVKLGLFAALGKFLGKAWKLVAVAVVGLGAWLKNLFSGGRRGRMSGGGDPGPGAA